MRLPLEVWRTVILAALLSSLAAIAPAHEIRPAVMDLDLGERAEMTLSLNAEALLAGVDLSLHEDTDDAPEAAAYDALRALPDEALAERLRERGVAGALLTEGLGGLELLAVEVIAEPDAELPRDTLVTLAAPVAGAVRIGPAPAFGSLILRQEDETAFAGLLGPGELSPALEAGSAEGFGATLLRYTLSGFEHIIPKGVDHILFVLGLFFFSLHLAPLLWQVTAFTLAHTVTLALAATGVVSVPASIVEPLIALSIAYVAVENIVRPRLGWWRPAIVFAFGLLHGLGFASVLGEVTGGGSFVARLVGFNVGVELGQLAVIAIAWVLLALPFGRKDWWRARVAIPASAIIAAFGIATFLDRAFGVPMGPLGFLVI